MRTPLLACITLIALVISGCERTGATLDATPVPPDAARPDAQPDATPPPPPVRRFAAQLMGTSWSLLIVSPRPAAEISAAADAAFQEVERLEQLLSEWRPASALSAINLAAGKAPVVVDTEVLDIIEQSLAVARQSGGAFDPTWAALRGVWDFNTQPPHLPRLSALKAALAHVGYARVQVDRAASTVFLPEAGMALGLGGIAKGYAVDRAAAILRARGFDRFIVEGGGDLYVAGEKRPGEPWVIGVQHPRAAGALVGELPVRDAAIVSSGDYERFFELGGRRYHHIIDLKTGMPATRSVAVTVIAPDATRADAIATACFVRGPDALAGLEPGVEVAILTPDGAIYHTPGLAMLGARWDTPPPAAPDSTATQKPKSF